MRSNSKTLATSFVKVRAPLFDLAQTLDSGQVFHWLPEGEGWRGLIGDLPVYVEQRGSELVATCEEPLLCRYFALDHPLEEIYNTFPQDPFMREALERCRGIRIIRQPRWECLATFITSSMKQVSHIRGISFALRSRFGNAIAGSPTAAYPSPARIATATEDGLLACGLGYRAKLLLATARRIDSEGIDLDSLEFMQTQALREFLCSLPGVGKKIANCVLLFAYERLDAVPIDVWIARVLTAVYLKGRKRNPAAVENAAAAVFGIYGGYAQQYAFHFARLQGRKFQPA